jgi:hypothetical protein
MNFVPAPGFVETSMIAGSEAKSRSDRSLQHREHQTEEETHASQIHPVLTLDLRGPSSQMGTGLNLII